ncbi:MAG: hypothetical protein NVS9B13_25650 [Candidatus Acidiferrum sp.]
MAMQNTGQESCGLGEKSGSNRVGDGLTFAVKGHGKSGGKMPALRDGPAAIVVTQNARCE